MYKCLGLQSLQLVTTGDMSQFPWQCQYEPGKQVCSDVVYRMNCKWNLKTTTTMCKGLIYNEDCVLLQCHVNSHTKWNSKTIKVKGLKYKLQDEVMLSLTIHCVCWFWRSNVSVVDGGSRLVWGCLNTILTMHIYCCLGGPGNWTLVNSCLDERISTWP